MKTRLTFLFCIYSSFIFAQLQRNYTSYSVDNGLAQNSVNAIYQDYRGYLWFSTSDGLNRFDGYKMSNYKNDSKDSTSIGGIKAFTFYEDNSKRLWVGHFKGISVYNRLKDNFINIDIKEFNRPSIVLCEDEHEGLWLLSGVTDLVCVNKKTLKFERSIKITDEAYGAGSIRSFVKLGNTIIGYLNDRNEWFHFNLSTHKIKVIKGPKEFLGMFYPVNDSTLCSFTRDYKYTYHINSNHFEKTVYHGIKFTEYNVTGSTMIMWNGLIYIGNITGLYVYNPETNTIIEHIKSFTKFENTGYFYVQNLWVDKSNNLWISTNGDGVKCLSPYANKFKHYASNEAKNRLVKAICTDKKGNIFTGLWGQDILWYTKDGKVIQHYFKKDRTQISSVLGLTPYDDEHIIAVNDRSLKIFNPETKKITFEKELDSRDQRGIGHPHFIKLNSTQWLVCADKYLYEFNKNGSTKTIIAIKSPDTNMTVAELSLPDSNIWYGTNKCLIVYNKTTRSQRYFLANKFIKAICIASNNLVYVGTEQGLFELNKKGELLNSFSISNKLISDFVYGILEDGNGNIWFSHNKGLSCMNLKSKIVKNFSPKDGVQSNEFNTGAYYKDEKGLLYFGGTNGINVIDPDHIIINKHLPQIGINEINLNDAPYKTDTAYNELSCLNLLYQENTLSFDFSALEFSQPEYNTYQYMLSGYDNIWIESGTKHFVRYANLPPGKYILKIKAANGDGVWNETPRELPINIAPPFWQTTWFYVLEFLLAATAIGVLVYVFVHRQNIKSKRELDLQHKLEQERLRISRDLHDNVGAQLSYLITNVEWMLENPNQLSAEEENIRLKSLTEAGRNAVLTLRQTIWAISHASLSIEEFADRFKQFALKMLEFNKEIHVAFTEHFEMNHTLSPAVALNIFRICQEAFNNALKHSECTTIKITFTSTKDEHFSFMMHDNGKGFLMDEAIKTGHYGIKNMYARAGEAGCTLVLKSDAENGTILTIALK